MYWRLFYKVGLRTIFLSKFNWTKIKKKRFQFTKLEVMTHYILNNFTIQHALKWFIMIHVFHIQTKIFSNVVTLRYSEQSNSPKVALKNQTFSSGGSIITRTFPPSYFLLCMLNRIVLNLAFVSMNSLG